MQYLRDLNKRLNEWLDKWLQHDGIFAVATLAVILVNIFALLHLGGALWPMAQAVSGLLTGDAPARQQHVEQRRAHPVDTTRQLWQPATRRATDSAGLRLVGRWAGGSASTVAADGKTVYSSNGAYLEIIDFPDADDPSRMGRIALPVSAADIALGDGHVYVTVNDVPLAGDADGEYGLIAVSITDPANPQIVDTLNTHGDAQGVAVADDYVYVADGENGLRIIDRSDPAHMREVGSLVLNHKAGDVEVVGGYTYLSAGQSLRVVDVSDPTRPRMVSSVHLGAHAMSLAVADGYVYVFAFDFPSRREATGRVAWRGTHGLRVVDISNPRKPQAMSLYEHNDFVGDVEVTGDYVYLAGMEGGLPMIDVADKASPKFAAGVSSDRRITGSSVAVAGDAVYLAAGHNGLYVLEFAGPKERK
jgi:hypothetical protein